MGTPKNSGAQPKIQRRSISKVSVTTPFRKKCYISLLVVVHALFVVVLFSDHGASILKTLRRNGIATSTTSYRKVNVTSRATYGWKTLTACSHQIPKIFYFIDTTPNNLEKRQWLRKTIGDPYVQSLINSSIVFFVGSSANHEEQRVLVEEAIREGDLVVLNITESHRNLTLKFLLVAKWILDNCPLDASVTLVKMDDDVFVNVYALSSYASSSVMWLTGIHCVIYRNAPPQRKQSDQWYVSKEEYASDVYPAYSPSPAHVSQDDLK